MLVELSKDTIAGREVLVYEFLPRWSWPDFYAIKETADALLEQATIPVPLIFDLRQAPDMPPGMLTHARRVAETRHPNGTPVIMLGASRIIRTTTNIIQRMLGALSTKF